MWRRDFVIRCRCIRKLVCSADEEPPQVLESAVSVCVKASSSAGKLGAASRRPAAALEPFVYHECAADLGLLHLVGRRAASDRVGEVPDLRLETAVSATEAFSALIRLGSPSGELATLWSCCRRSPKSLVEIAVSLRLSHHEVRAPVREAVSNGLLLVRPDVRKCVHSASARGRKAWARSAGVGLNRCVTSGVFVYRKATRGRRSGDGHRRYR